MNRLHRCMRISFFGDIHLVVIMNSLPSKCELNVISVRISVNKFLVVHLVFPACHTQIVDVACVNGIVHTSMIPNHGSGIGFFDIDIMDGTIDSLY